MKMIFISLCTNGIMKDQYIAYSKLISQKLNLYCITNDNISNKELGAINTLNVSYKRKKPWSYFSLISKSKIKKYIKTINPDVIFIFTPHPANILIAKYIKKYKNCFWVHDPIPHSGTKFLDKIVIKLQLKMYYKIANVLFVAGEKLKQDILTTSKIDSNKIKVVPFAFIDNLENKNNNVYNKDIDLLFFGRIEYYKGLDVLAESLKLCQSKPRLYVVGKGSFEKAYGQKLEFGLSSTIINDYVTDDKLVEYLLRSKIVILPYRDATGSVTIAQAFRYNIPVISTNVGVFPEYVGAGGIIVDANDSRALAEAIDKMMVEKNRLEFQERISKIYESNFKIESVIMNIIDKIIEI